MKDFRSLEQKIRQVVAEASALRNTKLRREVVNVGRPDTAPDPTDPKSKLSKEGNIEKKIIEGNTPDNWEDNTASQRKKTAEKLLKDTTHDKTMKIFNHFPKISEDVEPNPPVGKEKRTVPGGKDPAKQDGPMHDMDVKQIRGGKTQVDLHPRTDDSPEDSTAEDKVSKKATNKANKEIGAKSTVKEELFSDEEIARIEAIIEADFSDKTKRIEPKFDMPAIGSIKKDSPSDFLSPMSGGTGAGKISVGPKLPKPTTDISNRGFGTTKWDAKMGRPQTTDYSGSTFSGSSAPKIGGASKTTPGSSSSTGTRTPSVSPGVAHASDILNLGTAGAAIGAAVGSAARKGEDDTPDSSKGDAPASYKSKSDDKSTSDVKSTKTDDDGTTTATKAKKTTDESFNFRAFVESIRKIREDDDEDPHAKSKAMFQKSQDSGDSAASFFAADAQRQKELGKKASFDYSKDKPESPKAKEEPAAPKTAPAKATAPQASTPQAAPAKAEPAKEPESDAPDEYVSRETGVGQKAAKDYVDWSKGQGDLSPERHSNISPKNAPDDSPSEILKSKVRQVNAPAASTPASTPAPAPAKTPVKTPAKDSEDAEIKPEQKPKSKKIETRAESTIRNIVSNVLRESRKNKGNQL